MGSMKINYNATAMVTNNSLTRNDSNLSESTKKLSSGLKINNAKDNPSGLAMAKRMNLQLKGLEFGKDNSNEGVSIVRTADGALSEITEMLQRTNELAIKGANGTMSDKDREALEAEVKQLKEEIERIASETQFNGQKILDGTFDLKGYSDKGNIDVLSYSDEVLAGTYEIAQTTDAHSGQKVGIYVELDENGNIVDYHSGQQKKVHNVGDEVLDADGNPVKNPDGSVKKYDKDVWAWDMEVTVNQTLKGSDKTEQIKMTIANVKDDVITLKGSNGYELQLKYSKEGIANTKDVPKLDADGKPVVDDKGQPVTETHYLADETVKMNLTGNGTMRMQVGANEGQVIEIRIPSAKLENLQIDKLTLSTQADCLAAIDSASGALQYVSAVRSRLGAYENRLEHKISSIETTYENMTSAYSSIMDVDMAEEMTNYTTQQVLSQSSMAMLAQANERPSQVLQLLQ